MNHMRRMRRGAVAVEFALIAPVLIVMFTGTLEIVQAVKAQSAFQRALASTLNVTAMQSGVTSAKLSDFCKGAVLSLYPFTTTMLSMTIASVTNTSGNIARDWEYSAACPTQATPMGSAGAVSVASSMVPSSGDSTIVIQASYVYTPIFKTFIPVSITFSRTAFSRPRRGAIPCSSGC